MGVFYDSVRERFLRYARIDTQSASGAAETPSTSKQFDLARVLRDELIAIGVSDVWLDEEHCVVYGVIPSNTEGGMPIGYVAHMDTATEAPGGPVIPQIIENYDGNDILLNKEKDIWMRRADFPKLGLYVGEDLICTDGTTLLGGDDKASIASIMTMAEFYTSNPEVGHGTIALAFTPDEEVGGLAKDLDLNRFASGIAYTLDGDHLGYYEYETFNASQADITVRGRAVHPGTAKGIMINSIDVANEFISSLPYFEKPQYTDGREGFFYVMGISGSCEETSIRLIIRDHDAVQFRNREHYLYLIAEELNKRYPDGTVAVAITEQYRSMKEVIDTVPFMVDNLKKAISDCGIEPVCIPFRGGTDGSALSQRGLPCPNLSAGYENAHSRFEYVPIVNMEKNVEILIRLNELYLTMND
ncbi:MAG: peptidase T [Oscillospiraceae bacterium]|nr:peptidase T [Oscillospiraceae bacterium]MBQ5412322.1 peptidase T [Oscillospiraceae bacterium]